MEKEEELTVQLNVIKIGKYILNYPKCHPKKKPIHKQAMKELRNQESNTLDLSYGKYTRFKWNKVIKYIRESEVQRILAYGNNDKNMLLVVSQVIFQNLTLLDLRDCQIENIESIPSGQNLNYLSLENNNIYSVESLIKCEFKGLKTLILNDNPIVNLKLERCNFQLQTFWLERKYNTKVIRQCLSQTCILKLKSEDMNDIAIQSANRIYQPYIFNSIKQKYFKTQRLYHLEPDDFFDDGSQFDGFMSDEDDDFIDAENPSDEEQTDPPPLHFVDGQNQQNWISEQMTTLNIQNSWESNSQSEDSSEPS